MRTPRARELMHPVLSVPSVATVVGYYIGAHGRNIGEELQFCDGHRCKLTYNEIGKLQDALEAYELDFELTVTAVEEVEA